MKTLYAVTIAPLLFGATHVILTFLATCDTVGELI